MYNMNIVNDIKFEYASQHTTLATFLTNIFVHVFGVKMFQWPNDNKILIWH